MRLLLRARGPGLDLRRVSAPLEPARRGAAELRWVGVAAVQPIDEGRSSTRDIAGGGSKPTSSVMRRLVHTFGDRLLERRARTGIGCAPRRRRGPGPRRPARPPRPCRSRRGRSCRTSSVLFPAPGLPSVPLAATIGRWRTHLSTLRAGAAHGFQFVAVGSRHRPTARNPARLDLADQTRVRTGGSDRGGEDDRRGEGPVARGEQTGACVRPGLEVRPTDVPVEVTVDVSGCHRATHR